MTPGTAAVSPRLRQSWFQAMTYGACTGLSLSTLLAVPWRTMHSSLRWLMLIMLIGSMAAAWALGVYSPTPGGRRLGVVLCCGAVGCAWAFWLSASALLALDARRLRLPGMERAVVFALLLYGVITVGAPTILLAAFGAAMGQAALWLALAASGGLAFALLPRWFAILLGFLPMWVIGLDHRHLLPPLHDAPWLQWEVLILAVLLAAIVMRWRRLLWVGDSDEASLSSAVVMQYRRRYAGTGAGTPQADSGQLIRQRPGWLQPRVVLGDAGPRSRRFALRLALGGQYLPVTLGSRLRSAAPVLVTLSLLASWLAFSSDGDTHAPPLQAVLLPVFVGLLGAMLFFGGLMLAISTDLLVGWRWRRVNTELPLLALLPGLGTAHERRRDLLRVLFGLPVMGLAALLVMTVVAASFVHMHGLALLLVALPPFAAAGTMLAQTLCTLGDCRLPRWGEWLYYLLLATLILLSVIVPTLTFADSPSQAVTTLEQGMLLGWMVMVPVMIGLGRRGWRAFLGRPHPFLPIS